MRESKFLLKLFGAFLTMLILCLSFTCCKEKSSGRSSGNDNDEAELSSITSQDTEYFPTSEREEKLIEELKTFMEPTVANDTFPKDDLEYVRVSVICPDYSAYFLDIWEEAESKCESAEEFGEVLFEMAVEQINSDSNKYGMVRLYTDFLADEEYLTAVNENPEKLAELQAELIAQAEIDAVNAEIEEFCIALFMDEAPEFSVEETTEAEQ